MERQIDGRYFAWVGLSYEAPGQECRRVRGKSLGMIFMGEQFGAVDLDELGAPRELLKHSSGLRDRKKRIFGTPDATHGRSDAAMNVGKAVEKSEVQIAEKLQLICRQFF